MKPTLRTLPGAMIRPPVRIKG